MKIILFVNAIGGAIPTTIRPQNTAKVPAIIVDAVSEIFGSAVVYVEYRKMKLNKIMLNATVREDQRGHPRSPITMDATYKKWNTTVNVYGCAR